MLTRIISLFQNAWAVLAYCCRHVLNLTLDVRVHDLSRWNHGLARRTQVAVADADRLDAVWHGRSADKTAEVLGSHRGISGAVLATILARLTVLGSPAN